jgi:hypothetical protein
MHPTLTAVVLALTALDSALGDDTSHAQVEAQLMVNEQAEATAARAEAVHAAAVAQAKAEAEARVGISGNVDNLGLPKVIAPPLACEMCKVIAAKLFTNAKEHFAGKENRTALTSRKACESNQFDAFYARPDPEFDKSGLGKYGQVGDITIVEVPIAEDQEDSAWTNPTALRLSTRCQAIIDNLFMGILGFVKDETVHIFTENVCVKKAHACPDENGHVGDIRKELEPEEYSFGVNKQEMTRLQPMLEHLLVKLQQQKKVDYKSRKLWKKMIKRREDTKVLYGKLHSWMAEQADYLVRMAKVHPDRSGVISPQEGYDAVASSNRYLEIQKTFAHVSDLMGKCEIKWAELNKADGDAINSDTVPTSDADTTEL